MISVKNEIDNIVISDLSSESRRSLHKLLYRHECRVWLLALSMPFLIIVSNIESNYKSPIVHEAVFYIVAAFLVFWAAYPSIKILQKIRKEIQKENSNKTEINFTDSLESLLDFLPPILIPASIFMFSLIYRLWYAI